MCLRGPDSKARSASSEPAGGRPGINAARVRPIPEAMGSSSSTPQCDQLIRICTILSFMDPRTNEYRSAGQGMEIQRASGDRIVLREIWQGRVWSARPVTVVLTSADWIALYLAEGTGWQQPRTLDGQPVTPLTRWEGKWCLREHVHSLGSNLLLVPRDAPYSIQLMWSSSWDEFQGWYINLQDPLEPSSIGFDYMDQLLDMVVTPDLSGWRWKDEDEFEEAQSLGLISSEKADYLRSAGLEALELIRNRRRPLDHPWEDWRPDPTSAIPVLKHGWEILE